MKKRTLRNHWHWLLYALVFTIVFAISPGANALERMFVGVYHTLAINTIGDVYSWGSNQDGALGINNTTDKSTPQHVEGIANIIDVATGIYISYALDSDGHVWSWGQGDYGALGLGDTVDKWTPQLIPGLSNIVDIESFGFHALALTDDGRLWSWGYNVSGQIGNSSASSPQKSPIMVEGLSNVKDIAVGGYHSVALLSDGSVWAWGRNYDGQVGDGTTTNRSLPVQVKDSSGYPITNVKAIFASARSSFAIQADGVVLAWGLNDYGQLGDGTDTTSPSAIPTSASLYNSTAIYPNARHSIAQLYNGTIMTWGRNTVGELGNGVTDLYDHLTPEPVDIANVTAIYQGSENNFVEKVDGTFWGWGRNYSGSLGKYGVTTVQPSPVQIDFNRLYGYE